MTVKTTPNRMDEVLNRPALLAFQPVDLATLAGPVVVDVETHLYIARRMANGEAGQRVFLCTLPVGAHLLPMQSAHHIFLAVPTAAAPAWESGPFQANALALWQMALAQAPCTAAQGRREQTVRIVQAQKSFQLDAQEAITARAPLWILSEEPAFAFADSSAEAAQNTGHHSASLAPMAAAPLGRGWVIHTTCAAEAAVVTPDDFLAHAADDVVMQVATTWAQQAAAWLDAQLQQTGEAVRQSRRQAAANYERALANVAQAATGISPATRQTAERDPLTAALNLLGRQQGFTIQLEEQKEPQADPERRLAQLAQIAGFGYRRVTLSDDWQHEAGLPLLGFGAEGQPLVLLPERLGYVALDPVTNVRLPVDADVAALLAPQAYQLYASLPDRLDARTLIRFVLRGGWSNIGWMLIGAFMVMLLGLVTPIVMGAVVGRAIPMARLDLLVELVLVLVTVAINITLFRIIGGQNSARFTTGVDLRLQPAVWDRVMRLPSSFFRRYGVGDLATRVLGIKQIATTLTGTAVSALLAGVMSLTSFGLMAWYSPALTRFALVYGLLTALLLGLLVRRQVRWTQEAFALQGQVKTLTLQLLTDISKLRVAAAEKRAFARWGNAYAAQRASQMRAAVVQNANTTALAVIPIIGTLGLFFLAELDRQTLDVAAFVAFYTAFGQFMAAVMNVSQTLVGVLNVAPLYERAQPILREAPEVDASRNDPGRLSGAIAVRHLTFRYHDSGPNVLHDVSFDIQPGEFVAVVGPSGAGKSTILRLLLGFDQPTAGAVYYDSQDLAQLDLRRVRQQIGTVLQHVGLTPGSIYENIAGAATISRADVMEAARLVGLDKDIEQMPMGLETMVSEGGGNLSGGQRQRLIIARVLVRKPRLIFFDEATSALDNRTQAVVTESLARFKTTRLVIAHRLSTIRGADKILVLDQGHIVQQGSFDDLMAQDGLFQELVRRQMA